MSYSNHVFLWNIYYFVELCLMSLHPTPTFPWSITHLTSNFLETENKGVVFENAHEPPAGKIHNETPVLLQSHFDVRNFTRVSLSRW